MAKKYSYIISGNHTDSEGNYFPRNSVIKLTEEEASKPIFENKLTKVEVEEKPKKKQVKKKQEVQEEIQEEVKEEV
jgi:hypothetical protein